MLLSGKTIIITGAAGALGRSAISAVRAQGGQPILLDRAFPDDFPADLSGDAPQYEIDLTDGDAVQAVVSRLGDFEGVFNIAGGFAMGTEVADPSDADWAKMMALNVETLRHMIKAATPIFVARGAGAMVNVGAAAAQGGVAGMGAYIASKSVVMRLTETLAQEVGPKGVNVNAVLPTIIDTPANRDAMPTADPADWVSPDRLAATMCFLASDLAKDIHGALLPVRGRV